MRILILICVLPLISKAQHKTYFESVNINYNSYLKKSFLPSFEIQKKKRLKAIIFGFINKETELINITKEKSFSISSFDQ